MMNLLIVEFWLFSNAIFTFMSSLSIAWHLYCVWNEEIGPFSWLDMPWKDRERDIKSMDPIRVGNSVGQFRYYKT